MEERRAERALSIMFLTVMFMLSVPLMVMPDRAIGGEQAGYMRGEQIYNSTRSLSGGLGVGDLDGDGEVEIAICDFEGNVVMLKENADGSFKAGKIWQETGTPGTDRGLFDIVITDALSASSGPEILVGGYSGTLYALHREGSEWTSTALVRSPFRIFEMELGDIDPAPGPEVLYGSMQNDQVDPDRTLRYIRRVGADSYEEVGIPVPEAVKAITVADADPGMEGEEIWITTSAWNDKGGTISTLVEVWNDNGTWRNKELFTDPNNLLTNVRVGDIWSGHPGNEMIITSLSGWCYLAYFQGGSLKVEPIFQAKTPTGSSFGLEGLALGDINPRHDGDEALVTGYYNRVYQVVEVAGEVISDLVWQKESGDIKLELSGVEIADVTDRYAGNEGLIASLQGWMELLSYEEDGISLYVPPQRMELVQGGEVRFPIKVIPSGLLKGPLSLEVQEDPSIEVTYPQGLVIEDHSTLDIVLTLRAKGVLTSKDLDIQLVARVGIYSSSGTLRVKLEGQGSTVTLFMEPSSGIVYTTVGSHLRLRIGVMGAESYDALDMAVSDAEGLAASINTPMVPGKDEFLTVLPLKGAEPGVRTLKVTASYAGTPVSEAELIVELRSLLGDLNAGVEKVEQRHYKAYLSYKGKVQVNHLSLELMLGPRSLAQYPDETLFPGYNRSMDIYLEREEGGSLTLFVDDLTKEEVGTFNLGFIGRQPQKEQELDWFWVVVGVLLVLIAVVFIGVVFMYSKGTSESEARIDRIGDYGIGSSAAPPRRDAPSQMRRSGGSVKEPPRRAPPPPFRTAGEGRSRRLP